MSIAYNTLALAGLSVLMTGALTVSAITLYKNTQQGKKIEEVTRSVEAIETKNSQAFEGFRNEIQAQSEEQKKANKNTNAELVSAKNELSEAQKKLDLAKSVLNVVNKDLCDLIDNVVAIGNNPIYLDQAKFPFLVGAGAVPAAAANGIETVAKLVDQLEKAMKTYTRSNMQQDPSAHNVAGRLKAAAAAAMAGNEAANIKAQAKIEAQQRLEDAQKAFDEARAKVAAIESTLD